MSQVMALREQIKEILIILNLHEHTGHFILSCTIDNNYGTEEWNVGFRVPSFQDGGQSRQDIPIGVGETVEQAYGVMLRECALLVAKRGLQVHNDGE